VRQLSIVWFVGLIASLLLVRNVSAVTLEWNANTEPDLSGYNVYWCDPPAVTLCDIVSMSQTQDVGNQTTIQLTQAFEIGTVFFVTAYDTSRNESPPSNRVQLTQVPPSPPPPEPPPSGSLVHDGTHIADSGDFDSNHPVEHLWDGCIEGTRECMSGAGDILSFWVEFDFRQDFDLTHARLFGDAAGKWWSESWTLQHKRLMGNPWVTAFANADALVNDWVTQDMRGIRARFVRVTVFGNQGLARTQARELEIFGTPSAGPPPIGPPAAPSGLTIDVVIQ